MSHVLPTWFICFSSLFYTWICLIKLFGKHMVRASLRHFWAVFTETEPFIYIFDNFMTISISFPCWISFWNFWVIWVFLKKTSDLDATNLRWETRLVMGAKIQKITRIYCTRIIRLLSCKLFDWIYRMSGHQSHHVLQISAVTWPPRQLDSA